VCAKDFGVVGPIYDIEEVDLIEWIYHRLKSMQDDGSIEQWQELFTSEVMKKMLKPRPVPGLQRTQIERVFEYDPSFEVMQDVPDNEGSFIFKKGQIINPLDLHPLNTALIIFDGDDVDQKQWAKHRAEEIQSKLILVNGSPAQVQNDLQLPVFFDQHGYLVNKFGLKQVPAILQQKGSVIEIREIVIE